MAAMTAIDLATNDYGLDLEKQLSIHLSSNHYPAVPVEMLPICIEALDAVNTYSDWSKQITLPEGVSWKGLSVVDASVVIEAFHLEFWLIEKELFDE
jgi:hypothetical protein